jgi:hypothetical protein
MPKQKLGRVRKPRGGLSRSLAIQIATKSVTKKVGRKSSRARKCTVDEKIHKWSSFAERTET